MSKRVRVTIELSESFVRLLNANVNLNGGLLPDRDLAVDEVLARVVLAEARGAHEVQVHAVIPPKWRPDIEAVHAARVVIPCPDCASNEGMVDGEGPGSSYRCPEHEGA